MITKYETGQTVLVPGVIRNAKSENGVILYDIETSWEPIREEDIIVDDRAINTEAFRDLAEQMYPVRY